MKLRMHGYCSFCLLFQQFCTLILGIFDNNCYEVGAATYVPAAADLAVPVLLVPWYFRYGLLDYYSIATLL